MPRVNKLKRDKAISALITAGMDTATANSSWRLLDLDKPLKDQIVALAEEDPELFDATDDSDDDGTPMTAREAVAARAKGTAHLKGMVYRRKATPRPSTASKSAQEAAAHLVSNSKTSPPPSRKYIEPVRDINGGHKPLTREPSASAKALAARLKGN
ncbi:hypothetical protein [Streptomyces scabiei]|uniref:hypothetical protein n=1 Tax=Streptomyces scabiei TaxID=1930 RepID=UPI0029B77CA0|nr:hypothetical protein [Streptomyces scabiei]MDX3522047.1 hypothetical protein [Streptomyces scabiei]